MKSYCIVLIFLDKRGVGVIVAPIKTREVRLGEYTPIQFLGTDALDVKRKVVEYWYDHRKCLSLSLREFLARCTPNGEGAYTISLATALQHEEHA